MASISDYVLDAALSKLDLEANRLDITSQEVTTYNEAISTFTLGNTTSVSFAAPVNGDVSGRKTTCAAVTDGSVTGNGTATHYAVTGHHEQPIALHRIIIHKPKCCIWQHVHNFSI
jgi:hypothetical protein